MNILGRRCQMQRKNVAFDLTGSDWLIRARWWFVRSAVSRPLSLWSPFGIRRPGDSYSGCLNGTRFAPVYQWRMSVSGAVRLIWNLWLEKNAFVIENESKYKYCMRKTGAKSQCTGCCKTVSYASVRVGTDFRRSARGNLI